MKRFMAALALAGSAALAAGCGGDAADTTAETDLEPPASSTPSRDDAPGPAAAAAAAPSADPIWVPVTDGAPAFAVLYPGATIIGEPVVGAGAAGPGGIVTFTTPADADAVVAFYRARAEAAGLSSVMAMNQGEARAYGAVLAEAGANLQVVASPGETGETSVQMSWSGG